MKFQNEKFYYNKYDFKTLDIQGKKTKVYRIISKINFSTCTGKVVVEGQVGGYCALETLSDKGNCWVDNMSVVGPDCKISGNAQVERSLIACDCQLDGKAVVLNSKLMPTSKIMLKDNSAIKNSEIRGRLQMKDLSEISDTKFSGNAELYSDMHIENGKLIGTNKNPVVVKTNHEDNKFDYAFGTGLNLTNSKIEEKTK